MKQKLRDITTDQVDEMIMIKWGKPVTNSNHTAFVSNSIIGKIYGIDGSSVRRLYKKRFEDLANTKIMTRKLARKKNELPIR